MAGKGAVGRRILCVLALAAAAILLPAFTLAGAPVTPVKVKDSAFSPRKPNAVKFGGSFSWRRTESANMPHNVRQDVGLFRSGSATSGALTTPFTVSPSAGSYHYYCEIHGSRFGGMDGVIKVRPARKGAASPHSFRVQWAHESSNPTGSRFDVRYKVDRRRWKVWRNDTKAFDGVFGRNDNPIRVSDAHKYKIAVRSEKGKVSKRSGWSPALSVTPPAP